MKENSEGLFRDSSYIVSQIEKPEKPLKNSKKSESLLSKWFKVFMIRILPLVLLIGYCHLRSKDDLMSLGFSISGYLLLILEFKSESDPPDKSDLKNIQNSDNPEHSNEDFLKQRNQQPMNSQNSEISLSNHISEISQVSHNQNISNLEQPLLSSKEILKMSPLKCRRFLYLGLSIITTLELVFKITFVMILLLDDSTDIWESKNRSLIEFLNVFLEGDEKRDISKILKEFLPDLLILAYIIFLAVYVRKEKPKVQNAWDINRTAWKLRLEALIIIGLIFAPFFFFNLLGVPFILFTVGFMICFMRNSFVKIMTALLKLYLFFHLIANHLANVPLIIESSKILRENKAFFGIDLYDNFLQDFYSFALNLLLILLLLISCLYSELLVQIEKPILIAPLLPLPSPMNKITRSFVSVISSQEEKESQEQENPNEKGFKIKVSEFFFKIYQYFLDFSQSLETILRVLQIYSIVIIMRYENIYPLSCLLWLFTSSLSMNHEFLSKISTIFVAPLLTTQILILYYSNIPKNENNLVDSKLFGFENYPFEGFEYIFLMIYLILQMTYIFQVMNARKFKKVPLKSQSTRNSAISKEVTFGKVLKTIIYKNSYFLALFILFWISLYTVNLIHLILALFFVSFFLKTGTNSLIFKDPDEIKKPHSTLKNNARNKKVVITFQQKYWIYLVLYVDSVIIIRHIWSLFVVRYYPSVLNSEYLDFLGLNYSYGLDDVNFGFQAIDFASNTINWVLFIFVVIQHDTYKSKIFTNAPNMMLLLKDYKPLQGKIFYVIEKIVRWVYIIYYKSILWVGYLVMISLLIFEPIDVINTFVLFILLVCFLWHLFKIQVGKVNVRSLYRFWLFLAFWIVLMNLLRYTYQFFRFQLLQKAFSGTEFLYFFNRYGHITGLFFYEPVCDDPNNCKIFPYKLRFGFIYNIIILFFAVLGYSYLDLVLLYEKSNTKSLDSGDENANNNLEDLEAGFEKRISFNDSNSNKEIGFGDYIRKIRRIFDDYVNVSIQTEIPGFDIFLYYACLFYISIMFFILMLFCVYFWLSIANFIYLTLYLLYFYKVHGSFIEFSSESNVYYRIKEKMRVFKHNFLSYEALTDPNFVPEHDYNCLSFLNDLNIVKIQCLTAKVHYKKNLWKITILFSVFCMFLTFLSQWCTVDSVPESDSLFIKYFKWGLFLFGTYNCDGNPLYKDIYPYYIFVILNFLELKSIIFLEETLTKEVKRLNLSFFKTKDNILLPIKTIKEPSLSAEKTLETNQTLAFKSQNFFKNHARSLKHDLSMAILYIFERVYLIVFLINSDINYNLFSMITFLTIVYLSLRTSSPTNIIRILNACSLVLLFIRYPLFLININQNTSPRRVPAELQRLQNLDLIDYLLQNSGFSNNMISYIKQYLALGEVDFDYVSFFINSIILYTVQLYFLWMLFAFKKTYECIEKRKSQFEDFQWNLLREYKNWMGAGMKLLTASHAFLYVNLNVILCIIMIFLLLLTASLYNFIFCLLFMGFLILNETYLTHVNFSKNKKISQKFFKTVLVLIIILLLAIQIIHFPILLTSCLANEECAYIFSMSTWDKLAALILIKFGLDLMNDKEYTKISGIYLIRKELRARLLRICYTTDINDSKIKNWVEKLENKLIMKEKVRFVIQKLEHWHAKYFSNDPKNKIPNLSANDSPCHYESSKNLPIEIYNRPNINTEVPLGEKKSKKKFREKLFELLKKYQDKYLFMNMMNLTNFILEKNRNIISTQTIELTDYMFSRLDKIDQILNYIDHLQSRFIKTLKHHLQNPKEQELINSCEANYEKFFFGVYEEVLESLKIERPVSFSPEGGPGRLLVKHPNNEGYLNLEEFEYGKLKNGEQPSLIMLAINIFQLLLGHWHVLCCTFVIFYIFFNNGLICILLPMFFFGFLLIEEKEGREKTWGGLILYFLVILIFKYCLKIYSVDQNSDKFEDIAILFGHSLSFKYEFFLIIILLIQKNLLKMKGLDKKVISEYENAYQSFLRKKLNNDFEDIKKNNDIIQELYKQQEDEEKVLIKEEEEKKESKPSFEDGGFYLKFLQENEKALQRGTSFSKRYYESSAQCNYDKLKRKAINELEREVMSNLLEVRLKNFHNNFFRFFSVHVNFNKPLFFFIIDVQNRKNGKDLYKYVLIIQIIIALYIFLLFSKMLDSGDDDTSIADSVKYSTFSGSMVLALFFHFSIMFIERLIMLYNPIKNEKPLEVTPSISMFSFDHQLQLQPIIPAQSEKIYKSQIFLKYVLLIALLFIIPYFILIFIPTHGTNALKERVNLNGYAICFFLIYCVYFYISAIQIKYGLRDRHKLTSLQTGYSQFQGFMFKVYRFIPFLFEFKTFMDWYFTETALSLVQWIKMEEINGKLFGAKCSSIKFKQRRHGNRVKWWIKFFMGGCGVFLLVLCIFGPMLLFSTLNPIAQQNLLQNFSLKVGALNVIDIQGVNDLEYNKEGFSDIPFFKSLDRGEFQKVQIQTYSDDIWGISSPNLDIFRTALNETIGGTKINQFDFTMEYTIKRERDSGPITSRTQNQIQNISTLSDFYASINDCKNNKTIDLPKFQSNTIRISSKSEVSLISYNDLLSKDIYLSLFCPSSSGESYWIMGQNKDFTDGIAYYTISNQSTSQLLGYSIIGFYVGVVYIIGKLLRGAISNKAVSFLFSDLPDPDSLIRLCESIRIARQEKNHFLEELFYYELMDLLKSPDVVKQITGSSVQTIKEKEKLKQKNV